MHIDVHYVHMQQQIIVTPTEARRQFFSLLRQIKRGKDVIVSPRHSPILFRISLFKKSKEDKLAALERMSKIGFKTGPWEEMKKIINTRYDNDDIS